MAWCAAQEYVAAVQHILPGSYADSSHHVRWAAAFEAALGPADTVLNCGAAALDPGAIGGALHAAWLQAPADTPPEDAARGHAALQIAATAAGFTTFRLTGGVIQACRATSDCKT